jgi:hypothetical protein
MEEYTPYVEQASVPLENYVCERMPSKPICIDFFIMNYRTFIFGGDDRNFDPYAGINASRAHVYVNPSTLQWEVKINSTRVYPGGDVRILDRHDSVGVFKPDEDVIVTRAPDGHIEVKVRFYNNYCKFRSLQCPSIDATIHLISNPSYPGGYAVSWKRDGFPSMGIYNLAADGTTYIKMAEDPERIRNPWLNWIGLINGRRSSNQLPPGCYFQ